METNGDCDPKTTILLSPPSPFAMISVAEARRIVLQHSRVKSAVRLAAADCLGLVLAEEITSDIDSPPFDKSMVDGYAVRSADLIDGRAELEVIEEIAAGAMAQKVGAPGRCWRIMTGATIPSGADAVVMHEHTRFAALGGTAERSSFESGPAFGRLGRVRIEEERFRPGQNIMRQGTAMRRGDVVLSPGKEIRPIEIGLLAEVGWTDVAVVGRPTVAVLSTGNEVVAPDRVPTASQIRNSNGPMLAAAIRAAGARPVELGICRDEPDALRTALAEGLRSDVLVISGGVSAGALDLVPGLLKELGVEEVFHKINLRPGKPLWFGVRGGEASLAVPKGTVPFSSEDSGKGDSPRPSARCLAFGLPGNPVSTLVCFELFVRPALAKLAGHAVGEELATSPARLTSDFAQHGERPTFHPAVFSSERGAATISPLRWSGSADMRTLVSANALAVFPPGDREFAAGDTIEFLPLS